MHNIGASLAVAGLCVLSAVVDGSGALLTVTVEADSTHRNPVDYVSRVDDPVLHTPSHRVDEFSSFDVSFSIHNREQRIRIRLSLSPNHEIFSEDAVVQYLAPDGTENHIEPIKRSDHRVYKGRAFAWPYGQTCWTNTGWARIAVHQDGPNPLFEGVFTVEDNHHHVQISQNYRQTRLLDDPEVAEEPDEYMIVWKDTDVRGPAYRNGELKRHIGIDVACPFDDLPFNTDPNHPVRRGLDVGGATKQWDLTSPFSKRQTLGGPGGGAGANLTASIGSTVGCPTSRRVALVGIVADCTYTRDFSSTTVARSNIIQQVNSASHVYETNFNISLAIRNLTISDANCPVTAPESTPWNIDCTPSVTIGDRLSLFSAWRGRSVDMNAYWTLMSRCNTGSAVGLAWMGQLCRQGASGSSSDGGTVAGANIVVRTPGEWQVFAHETGHLFGAIHDCTSESCSDGTSASQECCPFSATTCDANGQFIMNPSTGTSLSNFSPCSIGNICNAIGRRTVNTSCLTDNSNVTTITGSQCGNNIVEPGEDCDCGGTSGCGNNTCCDPTTCRFTPNSVCDPTNGDCCTQQCQFAPSATVCRPRTGPCDLAETCTGSSGSCPDDAAAPDGTFCGDSGAGLTCASGQCTSRDMQCRAFLGSRSGNNTYSCNSQSCQLSCVGRSFGTDTCFTMQQNFLDGTQCRVDGVCRNGFCEGASVESGTGSGPRDNRNVAIIVASVVGGLITIAALVCCCVSVFRKRRAVGGLIVPPTSNAQARRFWAGNRLQAPRGNKIRVVDGHPPPYVPAQTWVQPWYATGRYA